MAAAERPLNLFQFSIFRASIIGYGHVRTRWRVQQDPVRGRGKAQEEQGQEEVRYSMPRSPRPNLFPFFISQLYESLGGFKMAFITKSPTMWKSIICAVIALSFISVLPPLSSLEVPITDNPVMIDDQVLLYQNWESYSIGADPILAYPRVLESLRTPADAHFSGTVQYHNGSKQMRFTQDAATASSQGVRYYLPQGYDQYIIEFNLTIDSYLKDSAGGFEVTTWSSLTGSTTIMTSQSRFYYESGYNRVRVWSNTTGFVGGVIYPKNVLNVVMSFDDETRSVDYCIHNMQRDSYNNYTTTYYVENIYPTFSPSHASFLQFNYRTGETGGIVYIDDLRVRTGDPLRLIDTSPVPDGERALTMMYDDGGKSIITTAKPLMDPYDAVATVPIIVSQVGTDGYLTWSDVQELIDSGWEIASHSIIQDSLLTYSLTDAKYAILHSKLMIEENLTGYNVKTFVPPGNNWNRSLDQYAKSVGYTSTPYDYQRWNYYISTTNGTIDSYLERYYGQSGAQLTLYTHQITETPTAYDVYPWQIIRLLNVSTTQGFKWVTMNDVVYQRTARDAATFNGINITAGALSFGASDSELSYMLNIEEIDALSPSTRDEYYLVVNDDIVYTINASATDSLGYAHLSPGDYEIMTPSEYRQLLMDNAISPIFAIIPLVIVISAVSWAIGMSKRRP